jgi:hypothetical protein
MSIKAKTFLLDPPRETEVTVDVLSGPSSTGLCKVVFEGRVLARHVDRLTPVDDEAAKFLGKQASSKVVVDLSL